MVYYEAKSMRLEPHDIIAQGVLDKMIGLEATYGVITQAWVEDGWLMLAVDMSPEEAKAAYLDKVTEFSIESEKSL